MLNFNIGINKIENANEFLRCLWSLISNEFGKCAWQYMPYKESKLNKINFGQLDIGTNETISVSITYKTKGSIKDINFSPNHNTKLKESTVIKLRKCIDGALDFGNKDKKYYKVTATLRSYKRILNYKRTNFEIQPTTDNSKSNIIFVVSAFDNNQAYQFVMQKLKYIIDFLSVETQSLFTFRLNESYEGITLLSEEIYQESPLLNNANIDTTYENNYYKLSDEFISILEKVLDPDFIYDETLKEYFNSCGHYHSAVKTYENYREKMVIGSSIIGDNLYEVALTLFVSALEVITLKESENKQCKECNQPIFSIKKRVKSLIVKYYGEGPAKMIGNYYDDRSKYLHTGAILTGVPRTQVPIPTLSKNHPSGCEVSFGINLELLNDITREILRKEYMRLSL